MYILRRDTLGDPRGTGNIRTMQKQRVVITGIGAIAADSRTKDQLWKNLNEKHIHVAPVNPALEKVYRFKTRFFVPFPTVKVEEHGFTAKYNVLMEENSRLAVVCAKDAIEDAGFTLEKSDNGGFRTVGAEDAAVILGTGLTALNSAFNSFAAHLLSYLGHPRAKGHRFNKMVIPLSMPNSTAAWVSIMLGFHGESYTVNTACSSANTAIGQAFRLIVHGESKVVLSGGVECERDDLSAVMRGFDAIGALTTDPHGLPQPFSKDRSGFLFSEGAGCVLVLEELQHALARGASIYAEIVDCRFSSDGHHIVQMDESAVHIKRIISEVAAGRTIDYINAHGTGTVLNDKIEAAVIRDVFGAQKDQPLISSTKSMIGHSLGASAAVEAAMTALSLKHQMVHPNLSTNNIEDLNLVTESTRADIEYAVSPSFSFGGHNSVILFKRWAG